MTLSQHANFNDSETKADKWNSVSNFIIFSRFSFLLIAGSELPSVFLVVLITDTVSSSSSKAAVMSKISSDVT